MYLLILLLNLMVMLCIAFFTLFERKILSHIQVRVGPNKNSFLGVFQPVIDGLKLFLKENNFNLNVNKYLFNFFPFFLLLLMLMFWVSYLFEKVSYFCYSLIYVMMISSLGVYGILGSGWSSNSKYAMLGAYRSVCQVVSYEIGMVFLLVSYFIFVKSYNLILLMKMNLFSHVYLFGFFYFFVFWLVIILAELNRSPFDFSESESELVSGFNIEYGSLKFAFLFLSEYGNMVFMGLLTTYVFFFESFIFVVLVLFYMIWVRGSFPRFRYDNLMYMNWKLYLPLILLFFLNLFVLGNLIIF